MLFSPQSEERAYMIYSSHTPNTIYKNFQEIILKMNSCKYKN